MRKVRVTLAAMVLAGAALVGCGDDEEEVGANAGDGAGTETDDGGAGGEGAAGDTVEITAQDIAFDPTEITLTAGSASTIRVDNADEVEHNLTIEELDVDEDIDPGGSTEVSVNLDAGEYEFYCEYHPSAMTGTLTAE